VAVLVRPDIGTEVLIRTRRANRLPFGDPYSDSFVHAPPTSELRRSVAGLRAGERLLVAPAGLELLRQLRRRSLAQIAAQPLIRVSVLTEGQERALKLIDERFAPRVVQRDRRDFVVVELVPRQPRVTPGLP
jgi:hypothetical protein